MEKGGGEEMEKGRGEKGEEERGERREEGEEVRDKEVRRGEKIEGVHVHCIVTMSLCLAVV